MFAPTGCYDAHDEPRGGAVLSNEATKSWVRAEAKHEGVRVRVSEDGETVWVQTPPRRHERKLTRDMAVAIARGLATRLKESTTRQTPVVFPSGEELLSRWEARLVLVELQQALGVLSTDWDAVDKDYLDTFVLAP